MSKPEESDDIQRQMALVRGELAESMTDIVQSARQVTDWRYYVKTYPLACAAAAATLGYFLVPARLEMVRPSPDALMKLAKRRHLIVQEESAGRPRDKMLGSLFTLASNLAVRGAISYLSQQAGKKAVHEMAESEESRPSPCKPR